MARRNIDAKLTEKQEKFILSYCSDGARYNATQAAEDAGYDCKNRRGFEQIGYSNLKNPKIKRAISQRLTQVFDNAELSVDTVLRDLRELRTLSMQKGDYATALKSTEHMGRYLKMFVDKVEHMRSVDDASDEELIALLTEMSGKLDGIPKPESLGGIGADGPAEGSDSDPAGTQTTH